MIDVLEPFRAQLEHIDAQLADPAVMSDINVYKELMKERSHLEPIVEAYNTLVSFASQIDDAELMLKEEDDNEIIAMAKEEINALKEERDELEINCRLLLLPVDPLEGKNIIMEIRAGTGGDEAALFAADLFKMYSHFAENSRWKVELISSNETGIGGF